MAIKQQRDLLVEQLKRTLQPEVLGAGHQVAERLADLYLNIDQGGTFFGAVSGFGPGAYVNETFGGVKGLAKYLVEGGKVQTSTASAGGGKTRPVLAPTQPIAGARESYFGQPQTRTLGTVNQPDQLAQARQLLERGRELELAASRFTGIKPQLGGENAPQRQLEATGGGGGGLRPEEQNILNIVEGWLQKLNQSGYAINPARIAEGITGKDKADLLARAQSETDPVYASSLRLARENILQDFGWSRDTIIRYEQQKAQEFGRKFQDIGAQLAEVGLTSSGRRLTEENLLSRQFGEDIGAKRQELQQAGVRDLRTFGQKFGGRELPSLTLPETPTVSGGQFQFSGRELPFYETGPALEQVIGSQQKERALETEKTYRGFLEDLRKERETGLRTLQL